MKRRFSESVSFIVFKSIQTDMDHTSQICHFILRINTPLCLFDCQRIRMLPYPWMAFRMPEMAPWIGFDGSAGLEHGQEHGHGGGHGDGQAHGHGVVGGLGSGGNGKGIGIGMRIGFFNFFRIRAFLANLATFSAATAFKPPIFNAATFATLACECFSKREFIHFRNRFDDNINIHSICNK